MKNIYYFKYLSYNVKLLKENLLYIIFFGFLYSFLRWYQFLIIVVDLKVSLNCKLNQITKKDCKNLSYELIIDLLNSDIINNN